MVEWMRKDDPPVRLTYKMVLNGASAPRNYLFLVLDTTLLTGSIVAMGSEIEFCTYTSNANNIMTLEYFDTL